MGAPNPFNLVELGPGRGTLMADALRAASLVPSFVEAAQVQLVEVSAGLRKRQKDALQGCGAPVQWRKSLERVPRGPALIIANEFFDALPIRQFVRKGKGWHERCVAANAEGALGFSIAKRQAADGPAISSIFGPDAKPGEIVETRPAADELITGLGRRAKRDPVAALIIDYGHTASAPGDTLQAVRRHDHVSPFKSPGSADLTAHVDFAQLAATAAAEGLAVWGPVTQRMFLLTLGLAERCQALLEGASQQEAELIVSGAGRLVNSDQMGDLFKVLALASPGLPGPPALAAAAQAPA
jgi:NADH dehydrogenase [ubiquinone] 1 alpha subcomplex assembly factor 7